MPVLSSALPLIGNDLAPIFKKQDRSDNLPQINFLEKSKTQQTQPTQRTKSTRPLLVEGMSAQPVTAKQTSGVRRHFRHLYLAFAVILIAGLTALSGSLLAYRLTGTGNRQLTFRLSDTRQSNSLTVSTNNLRSALKRIEGQQVYFNINGSAIAASPADITSWLTVTTPTVGLTKTIGLNNSNIESYLSNLAKTNTKPAVNEIVVTHPDGNTVMLVQGINGFTVGSTTQAYNQITNKLLGGNGLNITLPGTIVPFAVDNNTAAYPKLIEVNVKTMHMYAYQNGQLIKTFLVSAGATATPTPIGTFHIWDKLTSQTMIGPGYVQPNVPWVNYFDHSGDAIHGNYWRAASVFGTANTSHGCVGVQVPQAEWIYNWAPIGTTVIIHQ